MKPISLFPLLAVVSLLGACAAFEGKEYSVNAYDARGRMLNKRFEMDSNKAGIPVARSVLCKRYPHATVCVYNNFTGQEVREYSPLIPAPAVTAATTALPCLSIKSCLKSQYTSATW